MSDKEYYSRIILRHGNSDNFPNLHDYEPGYVDDTNELYIGDSDGNIRVITDTQFKPLEAQVNNICKDIDDIQESNKHLIYDQIVGATNLINNGSFILPIKDGDLGISLVGDEFYPETKIYIDTCEEQGIGCKNCLTVINDVVHTAGVSFKFIDQHQSIYSIDKEFIISYYYRYENIIPGPDISVNTLKIGKVTLVLDYPDGSSETKIVDVIDILDGSSDWTYHETKFKINSNRTIDRVYGSISFMFEECWGDFSIAKLQCSMGNTPIELGMSDDDITYMIDKVNSKIESINKIYEEKLLELNQKNTDLSETVEDLEQNIDDVRNKILDFKTNPTNQLRNTGEFTCLQNWKFTDIDDFIAQPSNRHMKITKIAGENNIIQIQTSESLDCRNDFTLSILFKDERTADNDKLDVRLMTGYDTSLLPFEDYTITKYDDIYSLYVGKIPKVDEYEYSFIEYIGIYDNYFISSESIYIKNLKLSLVDYMSEWIPNPKDTVSSIRDYEIDMTSLEVDVDKLKLQTASQVKDISGLKQVVGSTELYNGRITNKNLYNYDYGDLIENKSLDELINTLFFKPRAPEILSVKLYKYEDMKTEIEDYQMLGTSVIVGRIVVHYEATHVNVNNIQMIFADGTEYHLVVNENIDCGIYYFEHGLVLNKSTPFIIRLETELGDVATSNHTVAFNPPIAYGSTLMEPTSMTTAEIMGQGLFLGNISESKEIELSFNHEGKKVFVAIPNLLIDKIRYIRDSNCINYLDCFDTLNLRLTVYGTVYDYTLYLMKHKTWMDDNLSIGLKGGSIGWQ